MLQVLLQEGFSEVLRHTRDQVLYMRCVRQTQPGRALSFDKALSSANMLLLTSCCHKRSGLTITFVATGLGYGVQNPGGHLRDAPCAAYRRASIPGAWQTLLMQSNRSGWVQQARPLRPAPHSSPNTLQSAMLVKGFQWRGLDCEEEGVAKCSLTRSQV